jgi:hypothetical protein
MIHENYWESATDRERRLSRIAADVWQCRPWRDQVERGRRIRFPLAPDLMDFCAAWIEGSHWGVQTATGRRPDSAVVIHGMSDVTAERLSWREACRRALALHRADLGGSAGRLARQAEEEWTWAREDVEVCMLRLHNEGGPTVSGARWKVYVTVDDWPLLSTTTRRAEAARKEVAVLMDWALDSEAEIRREAERHGWPALMRAFMEAME